MKLFIEVQPNSYNNHGYNIVIYKGWRCCRWEVGRVINEQQLNAFIDCYTRLNGQEVKL